MGLEMKSNTKFSYVLAYIRNKFPMYHRAMTDIELGGLINKIKFNSLFKSCSLDEIKNGAIDKIIDEYVDAYARDNLREIWENFDKLKLHIIDVIKRNNRFNDSQELIEDIAMDIALNVSDQVSYHTVFSNNYDNEIFNNYLVLRNTFKLGILDYIEKYFKAIKFKIGFDKETRDYIFSMIADNLMNEVIKDEFNDTESIKKMFISISKDMTRMIRKRIYIILENIDLIFGISDREIVDDIVKMATINGEISALKIINGNLDKFILNYIKSKKKEKPKYSEQEVISYIYNYLRKEADEDLIDSVLYEFSIEVYNTLIGTEYKISNSEIMESRVDSIIRRLYLEKYHPTVDVIRERMRRQSVNSKKNNSSKRKEVDIETKSRIKKKIQKGVSCLLLMATLSSVGGGTVVYAVNRHNDKEALELVRTLDNTSYSISHSSSLLEQHSYDSIVDGILNYHSELKKYGSEYVTLCFYNAYSKGLNLEEMNRILHAVNERISGNNNFIELQVLLKNDDCFLDFIYDSLIFMGCDEIKDDKYMDALISYKQSFYGSSYGIASDFHMYEDDKKNLDKMIKLYEEYCRKSLINLGIEMKKNEVYNLDNVNSSNRGRGI